MNKLLFAAKIRTFSDGKPDWEKISTFAENHTLMKTTLLENTKIKL